MKRKKEVYLEKQVELLQTRLNQVKQETDVDNETHLSTEVNYNNVVLEEASETNLEKVQDTNSEDNKVTPHYDVILQVKPQKIPQIRSLIIDDQKCIVIPINENEQTTFNGLNDLI